MNVVTDESVGIGSTNRTVRVLYDNLATAIAMLESLFDVQQVGSNRGAGTKLGWKEYESFTAQ